MSLLFASFALSKLRLSSEMLCEYSTTQHSSTTALCKLLYHDSSRRTYFVSVVQLFVRNKNLRSRRIRATLNHCKLIALGQCGCICSSYTHLIIQSQHTLVHSSLASAQETHRNPSWTDYTTARGYIGRIKNTPVPPPQPPPHAFSAQWSHSLLTMAHSQCVSGMP